MLFLQTAADWLRARNLPFEMTALLPVPVNKLIDDWVLRAQDQQRRITALTRTALADEAEILLQRCTTIVPLYPEDIDATTLSSRAFRQHQYRRLPAILAQHADHRSEERRVGKEWVSKVSSRWSPYQSKKKKQNVKASI